MLFPDPIDVVENMFTMFHETVARMELARDRLVEIRAAKATIQCPDCVSRETQSNRCERCGGWQIIPDPDATKPG